MPSYRHIHYALRPAKNVERKLIVETMQRLSRIVDVPRMRYVGMGSVYFADFSLFHRRLGISEMHSIEHAGTEALQERLKFNRPYHTNLHFTVTSDALPTIPWDMPSLVWLDYDGKLSDRILTDLEIVVSTCSVPTVLVVTVNVEPGHHEGRYDDFVSNVSEELLPAYVRSDADLAGRKMGDVSRNVMSVLVHDSLAIRNGVLSPEERILAPQLLHFRYKDGARMLTVAWLLHSANWQERVASCNLSELPFTSQGDEPFEISVPKLTVRETLHLDSQLPASGTISSPGVAAADLTAYSRLYRYLPSFVDADL